MLRTLIILLLITYNSQAQNIKSIQLRPLEENNFSAIVPLGTVLELSFDDLDADAKDYQYKIEHMDHNWESSRLSSSQYIDGFDQNTIIDVTNSFNTLQSYSHYNVKIPNTNTIITKSGNYLLSILNDYDEVMFTRKFVLFENLATIGVNATRSRNTKTLNKEQTVQFIVNHPQLRINNPAQEINVAIIKNNNWNEKITNIQPTFFKPNQLLYTYTNKTNFMGANEYLNFDSKIIRNTSLNTLRVTKDNVFHHYLYPYKYNPLADYEFNPDINGQFVIRSLEARDINTEADYAMMHFSLTKEQPFKNKDVYVYGAYNNFEINNSNKMHYNTTTKTYEAAILLKQGFYNYTYATLNNNGLVNTTDVLGSFFETENEYTVIVYHKPFGSFFDRVIGVGNTVINLNR